MSYLLLTSNSLRNCQETERKKRGRKRGWKKKWEEGEKEKVKGTRGTIERERKKDREIVREKIVRNWEWLKEKTECIQDLFRKYQVI